MRPRPNRHAVRPNVPRKRAHVARHANVVFRTHIREAAGAMQKNKRRIKLIGCRRQRRRRRRCLLPRLGTSAKHTHITHREGAAGLYVYSKPVRHQVKMGKNTVHRHTDRKGICIINTAEREHRLCVCPRLCVRACIAASRETYTHVHVWCSSLNHGNNIN